jgi:glycolate oxidase FAD binding subunit
MIVDSAQLTDTFAEVVGSSHVRPATVDDRIEGCSPSLVVAPHTVEEVAAVLRVASEHGCAVVPRGGGTKQGWGNTPHRADVILSTHRMDQLIEHAYGDMTATFEAGITLDTLQRTLATHGQMLALDPPWGDRATLGGIVAADASGPLRVRYGTARDLVIGIGVVLADGTVAYGGGRVVKNVAGYDLMKLFTGAYGTLGIITTLTVRLHPIPVTTNTLRITLADAQAAQDLVIALNHSTITPTGLQITNRDHAYRAWVRLAGPRSSVEAQTAMLDQLVGHRSLPMDQLDAAASDEAWRTQAAIYDGDGVVARWSVVPTALQYTLDTFTTVAARLGLETSVVAQGTATGLVRWSGPNDQALLAAIGATRARLTEAGGSLVVQQCAPSLKERLDVWGVPGDALALMRRVKTQFDPHNTLNPGRYLGRM